MMQQPKLRTWRIVYGEIERWTITVQAISKDEALQKVESMVKHHLVKITEVKQ